MLRRWSKLDKDFKTSKGLFDITKIPDIYDCVKYDSLHNYNLRNLGFDHMDEFYNCAEALATVIIPQVRRRGNRQSRCQAVYVHFT